MLGWGSILYRAIMEDLFEVTLGERLERGAVMSHATI